MNRVLFITCILLLCISGNTIAKNVEMSFQEALKKNLVTISGLSNGGYIGQCLSLQVHNNTSQPLNLLINPGLIFVPEDTMYQNLVAVGGEILALNPKKDTVISLQTFCGKSYARGPRSNLKYKFWKQGSVKMQAVLGYIREHKIFNYLGQHAVWMFTNRHHITSVSNGYGDENTKKFVAFIAKTVGVPMPEYHVEYKRYDTSLTQPVFSNEVKEYYTEINWNFTTVRNLHIGIFKENGTFYREVHNTENITEKGHSVIVKFYAKQYPDGKYLVRLYDDDNRVYLQKTVIIGTPDYNN